MVILTTNRHLNVRGLVFSLAVLPFCWGRILFKQRGLLKEFIVRDIKAKFVGSFAGFLWAFINPLAQIFIYTFVFSFIFQMKLSRLEIGTDNFVIYLLSGLFPWIAFSEGLSRATGGLLENSNLITKVVFAVELVPTTYVSSAYILNGLGYMLVLVGLALKGLAGWAWMWIPIVTGLLWLFTLGLAAFLSALCVFLRDTQQILGIVIFMWFYLTPILYPLSMVPASFQNYLKINPLFSFIEIYHQIILRHIMDWELLFIAILWTILSISLGFFFFNRLKPSFADVL